MASLRDLRRRIKSIEKTKQVTKAMKAVSAAKMRRAQEDVLAARPFARRVRDVLGRVGSASVGVQHPLLTVREPKKVAYVVITADRGLCGGFNTNILRRAAEDIKKHQDADLICVGRKTVNYFKRRNYNITREYIGIGESADLGLARELATYVSEKYVAEEYDEVYLVYSEFVNVLVQKPVVEKLLPVQTPEEKGGEEGKKATVEYIFEPDVESMLARLLPMYVENSVFQSLLESKAGEHSARMTAMDNATSNANEMIDKLTLSLNRARQAAITKEISEIVGGAAALE